MTRTQDGHGRGLTPRSLGLDAEQLRSAYAADGSGPHLYTPDGLGPFGYTRYGGGPHYVGPDFTGAVPTARWAPRRRESRIPRRMALVLATAAAVVGLGALAGAVDLGVSAPAASAHTRIAPAPPESDGV